MPWFVWLVLAVGLGVAEVFTLTLALGLLAVAALVAAIVAGVGAPLFIQLLAFTVTAAATLLVVRPLARRNLSGTPLVRDGSDALVGRTGVVTQEVTALRGLVRLSGEEWSARAYDASAVIPPGVTVDVIEIDGATAIVHAWEA
ncbi:NfeD family protein [Mumia zhuanghuii]|uniref:NfeD family protein n=2 Tax=Mumia zhuanghuii TaxID=2585211 RepID=A0A5C4MZX4_9ACTN|nr:NfeD family protein [Mumia zhuanghuii]TNC49511.1 NfeD family protein [Mumia zhuanghuii]